MDLAQWEPDTPSSFLKSCGLLTKPWTHVEPSCPWPAGQEGLQGASAGGRLPVQAWVLGQAAECEMSRASLETPLLSFLPVWGVGGSWEAQPGRGRGPGRGEQATDKCPS